MIVLCMGQCLGGYISTYYFWIEKSEAILSFFFSFLAYLY